MHHTCGTRTEYSFLGYWWVGSVHSLTLLYDLKIPKKNVKLTVPCPKTQEGYNNIVFNFSRIFFRGYVVVLLYSVIAN